MSCNSSNSCTGEPGRDLSEARPGIRHLHVGTVYTFPYHICNNRAASE